VWSVVLYNQTEDQPDVAVTRYGAGWVVATADDHGCEIEYGQTEAFKFAYNVLETVPEPATLSLLVIGGLGLLRRKRR
jgi:hypothetical protein